MKNSKSTIPSRVARTVLPIAFAAALCHPSTAWATTIIGTAASFAVLGASAVTNTGPTTINGDLGVSPGSSITGFGSITLTGTEDQTNAVAAQAQTDAMGGFTALADMLTTGNETGEVLGMGVSTLDPGVYAFSSSAQLTGTLTLDAENNPDAVFVFKIGSTLTTASNAVVDIINGGPGVSVYWEVGSSATLGTGTTFAGNILADQSITLNTGATILCGRAIALNGAVTLDNNTVSANCAAGGNYGTGISDFGSQGFAGETVAAPEPGTLWLLGIGLLALTLRRWRLRKPAA
jgi:type VI secretion system secreted protein VgrG